MRITPEERESIVEMFREELEVAARRINERLGRIASRPASTPVSGYESVRRFYEDLADKPWSEADEECLMSLGQTDEAQLKGMMRESFRRSLVQPIPSFRYLVSVSRKGQAAATQSGTGELRNPDAVSAAERERLANLLSEQLDETANQLVTQLGLSETKAAILREQLEVAEARIIARFTPLI